MHCMMREGGEGWIALWTHEYVEHHREVCVALLVGTDVRHRLQTRIFTDESGQGAFHPYKNPNTA